MISLGQDEDAAPLYKRLSELGKDAHLYSPEREYVRGNVSTAWAAVKGPNEFYAALPFRIAVASRNWQWIKQSLSEELWPERLRQSPDYPENYAFAEAEGLLATGQIKEGKQHLAGIKARLDKLATPYPAGWSSSGEYFYYPCLLPGLMGDLAGVRAAEKDYLDNAPKDAWADSSRRTALAVAFARAGDPDRALYHMETVMQLFGPFSFVGFKLLPGLDSLRDTPRYLAMQETYQRWSNARKQHQAQQ